VPGFHFGCWGTGIGVRACLNVLSRNSPQCLHFFAAAAITSAQYGHLVVASGASGGPPCWLQNAEVLPISRGVPQRVQKFAIFYFPLIVRKQGIRLSAI